MRTRVMLANSLLFSHAHTRVSSSWRNYSHILGVRKSMKVAVFGREGWWGRKVSRYSHWCWRWSTRKPGSHINWRGRNGTMCWAERREITDLIISSPRNSVRLEVGYRSWSTPRCMKWLKRRCSWKIGGNRWLLRCISVIRWSENTIS